MKYRSDIDGLRAVAVLLVVFFHAGIKALPGGFVGVDVFFVISGYLITGLINAEIEQGRFSLAGFYVRRVRRIFPALFAVMAVTAITAIVMLSPEDLVSFGSSVAAAALFVSNILFSGDSGYFSAPAELKPLLHTWSLGVEEQFYLIFPALLMFSRRYAHGHVRAIIFMLALLSFACSIGFVNQHPASSFYLGQWRAWELALGVLAALGAIPPFRRPWLREAAAVTGLTLVVASAVFLSRDVPFPGVNALFPCLGALLVVHSGDGGTTWVKRLLSTRPFVAIGLISYSLYLWHWPLIVFAKRALLRPLAPGEIAGIVALSLLLAAASWKFVEAPFRRRNSAPSKPGKVFKAAVAAMSASVVFAMAIYLSHGWPTRFDASSYTHIRGREDYRPGTCFLDEGQTYQDWQRQPSCLIQHNAGKTILIWGDSFGAHYVPGLMTGAGARAYNYVQFTSYSCPPVIGAQVAWAPKCRAINDNIGKVLDSYHFSAVVVVARWDRYWNRFVDSAMLERTIAVLKSKQLPVVLVGQGPSFSFGNPADYVQQTGAEVAISRDSSAINRELRAVPGYDVFFDPNDALCIHGKCPIMLNGQFLYWDDGHYSSYGSRLASDSLVASIRKATPP